MARSAARSPVKTDPREIRQHCGREHSWLTNPPDPTLCALPLNPAWTEDRAVSRPLFLSAVGYFASCDWHHSASGRAYWPIRCPSSPLPMWLVVLPQQQG